MCLLPTFSEVLCGCFIDAWENIQFKQQMNVASFISCLRNKKSSPSPFLRLLMGALLALKQRLTQNSECSPDLKHAFSSTVGRRRPLSRLGWASERHPDVVAPHYRQALPHTAVWVLQPWHPRGSSWGSAEPSRRQLEGESSAAVSWPY